MPMDIFFRIYESQILQNMWSNVFELHEFVYRRIPRLLDCKFFGRDFLFLRPNSDHIPIFRNESLEIIPKKNHGQTEIYTFPTELFTTL